MARPPDGTTAAERSRTAILAAVAARAALQTDGTREKFAAANGLNVSQSGISRALSLRKRRAGANPTDEPAEREWLWDSFEVDAAKLGLDLIVAWIPRPAGAGRRKDQGRLLEALKLTPGVVDIQDCFDDTIVLEALAADPIAKRQLQDRLRELAPDILWSEVRQMDRDQPARGWLGLARVVAEEEERLQDPIAIQDG